MEIVRNGINIKLSGFFILLLYIVHFFFLFFLFYCAEYGQTADLHEVKYDTFRAFKDLDKIESRTSGCNSKYSVRYSWIDWSTNLRTSGFPNLVFKEGKKSKRNQLGIKEIPSNFSREINAWWKIIRCDTFVCPSNSGFGTLTEITQVSPSLTCSPLKFISLS